MGAQSQYKPDITQAGTMISGIKLDWLDGARGQGLYSWSCFVIFFHSSTWGEAASEYLATALSSLLLRACPPLSSFELWSLNLCYKKKNSFYIFNANFMWTCRIMRTITINDSFSVGFENYPFFFFPRKYHIYFLNDCQGNYFFSFVSYCKLSVTEGSKTWFIT